ncbi:MAG: sigma-54 dependent transcriptional regulator [Clostridiaceae bacterium]|nr:sigma-54 dependent transcriptional regulator [Clostridiaceae bacterium]MBW4859248.1 sigma-54 dependent transcriptional regulator [Clostridiaceae bacterium]MBW4869270.1 sigma-54 dependent transcriptional regulator [Clostridiaceae bacterium]
MNSQFKILVVDDEIEYQEVYKMILEDEGYIVDTASSGKKALEKLDREYFNLVLADLIMEGMNGIEMLKEIKKKDEEIEVIIVTGYGSIESAVEAIKQGAFSYFIKDHDPEELILEIKKVRDIFKLKFENKTLKEGNKEKGYLIETNNLKFKEVLEVAAKAAKSDSSIFITGESGVGKEIMARYIHKLSLREGKFVPVNCQALSENLLESELFGHEKGSFTGAIEKRIGRFEEANGGTLFLDEIGEMPISIQIKLLRALDTKIIERIGSNRPIEVDLRFVTATNKDMQEAIKSGDFRQDLYFRINTIPIRIPPLRERREDLPMFIDFFLNKYEKETKKRISKVEDEVINFLLSYDYPGNIRELRNIIERLIVLSDDGVIRKKYLPEYQKNSSYKSLTLKEYRELVEKDYIEKTLLEFDLDKDLASHFLGISKRQLYNKISEYDINLVK